MNREREFPRGAWRVNLVRVGLLTIVAGLPALLVFAGQDDDVGARLLRDPSVRSAVEAAKDDEPRTLADQARLCEIPAPPFKEAARAEAYAEAFRGAGLRNVRIDRTGNVLGERPGTGSGPRVVISAHLDTVFPDDTNVTVKREGALLRGPGIGDDCRGLAVVLAVARALDKARLQTPGSLIFVGTVGEEGLGDLRGVKALFGQTLKGQIDRFVSVDGGGLSMTHIGVGSQRYRVIYKGPGGHSYGAFGVPSPIHALGRAIAATSALPLPLGPRTTFNVGRIGGGTAVNAIASEAWMEVDLRSEDPAALQALAAGFQRAADQALADVNLAAQRGMLTMEKALIGDRPAARVSTESTIVRTALSVTRALGLPVSLVAGSTDANLPMSLNIPALTIEGGGVGSGAHSRDEAFDSTNAWQGTQRAVLLAIALTQN